MDTTKATWNFDNSYLQLPEKLYSRQQPEPATKPELVKYNEELAADLGLTQLSDLDQEDLASQLVGNVIPTGAEPIAQAYAGHQFGHFTILGDGRAILLGEQLSPNGQRFDIQLKGSGRTPYSRRGDGRATLYSMLREYLISEAMHHLGIPTSRSLAVVKTGLPVYRERVHAGAVLSRVSSSHIRVGSFEFVRQYLDKEELQIYLDYVIERHYPELKGAENPALALFKKVMAKQVELIVHWMRVGFIHGVMNTDNTSIAGESFDYGPCAFMNAYDPSTVFSSIDSQGRYSFGNQPRIAHWNLAVFAGTLLPLIAEEEKKGIELAQQALNTFSPQFSSAFYEMMAKKIGLPQLEEEDGALIDDLLQMMEAQRADYTNTFIALSTAQFSGETLFFTSEFQNWKARWEARLLAVGLEKAQSIMQSQNPAFIPRNHLVEQALKNAENGDWKAFDALLEKVQHPYRFDAKELQLQIVPDGFDQGYQTFCGT